MRKALIVGVNHYPYLSRLNGFVSDAYLVNSVLERNSDGTKNFDTKVIAVSDEETSIFRKELKFIG